MICIHCRTDAKYKDREGGKCSSCGHAFAFEPKAGAPLTDAAFASALAHVSSDGKVKWTENYLYYEVARRLQKKASVVVPLLAGAVAFALSWVTGAWPIGVVAAVFWAAAARALVKNAAPSIVLPPGSFHQLLLAWVRAHGEPAGRIVRKPLPESPRPLPADVPEYSFDRAVVCDRSETVDLLLANRFHFENNCAVLSVDGYPPQAFETVRAMLKRNPKLVVYALHDATLEGCSLARRLATSPAWFLGGARVIDVGISPRHARRFKGLWTPVLPRGAALAGATADDAWLARYSLGLAVIRPEQVIKRLFRAISGTPDALTVGLSTDAVAFAEDATVSDGGGDSFG